MQGRFLCSSLVGPLLLDFGVFRYTIQSTAPIVVGRDDGSAVVVLGWRTKDFGYSLARS
jgi:hypothetical protein